MFISAPLQFHIYEEDQNSLLIHCAGTTLTHSLADDIFAPLGIKPSIWDHAKTNNYYYNELVYIVMFFSSLLKCNKLLLYLIITFCFFLLCL
jgi:hypothetical protein